MQQLGSVKAENLSKKGLQQPNQQQQTSQASQVNSVNQAAAVGQRPPEEHPARLQKANQAKQKERMGQVGLLATAAVTAAMGPMAA